ncbi:hypothetical protein MTR67_023135 [Solanum verrucosum]|uniref:Uncharacterized protein n=1 Tax=Solanum verrucosum TaxID=315347 RepID=A0AAF0QVW4_SOLVR|nr:hypothetical protein MTR67_023135 [Solanum verrucosum]
MLNQESWEERQIRGERVSENHFQQKRINISYAKGFGTKELHAPGEMLHKNTRFYLLFVNFVSLVVIVVVWVLLLLNALVTNYCSSLH